MIQDPTKIQEAMGDFFDILAIFFSLFIYQPLMDNLESQTYEVFEKDPIKYSQYQQV